MSAILLIISANFAGKSVNKNTYSSISPSFWQIRRRFIEVWQH